MNSVNIIGNLVRDVDVRYTAGGTAVTDITVAVNDRKKVGEQWQDVVTFVDVTLWGNTAENAAKYAGKGKAVGVTGKLAMDSWEDKASGQRRTKLKVVCDQLKFLSPRGADDQRPPNDNYGEDPQVPVAAGGGPDGDGDNTVPF